MTVHNLLLIDIASQSLNLGWADVDREKWAKSEVVKTIFSQLRERILFWYTISFHYVNSFFFINPTSKITSGIVQLQSDLTVKSFSNDLKYTAC